MKKLAPVVAALLAVAPACEAIKPGETAEEGDGGGTGGRPAGAPPQAASAVEEHTAELRPVNDSGVRGLARLTLAGDRLTVRITARGLEENRIHKQYIAGGGGGEATCPTEAEDENGNGFVEHREAQSAYQRIVLPLEPFPTTPRNSDEINVQLVFPQIERRRVEPLEDHAVVLAGGRANIHRRGREGRRRVEYVPSLPVACGLISTPKGAD